MSAAQRIPYYQFVPMILLVQALLFYVPYGIWIALSTRSGVDVHSIVEAGQSFTVTDMTEIRDKTLMYMTMMMDRYLRCHNVDADHPTNCTLSLKKCLSRTVCRRCGRRRGNYLIILYLVIKALYVVNVIGQLFLLDVFLGVPYHSYGFDVLAGIVEVGSDWSSTPSEPASSARFPRITMCDLKVRRLGAVHRYNVQCVLPINLFNEKIFLFLYFWMVCCIGLYSYADVFVAVLTFWSFITWLLRFTVGQDRRRYVKKHLRFLNKFTSDHERRIVARRFVHGYLGEDGVFILRLVGHNTNTITVTEFVEALWDNFKKKPMAVRGDAEEADL